MPKTNDELEAQSGDSGAAAAMEWLDSKATTHAEEDAKPAVVDDEQSKEVTASEEPEAEAAEDADNQETEPAEPEVKAEDSVLKFLPDKIRSDFEAATSDEERAGVIRKALMLQADYTRKTQDLAKERDTLTQKAQWWDQLASDPNALAALSKTTVEDEVEEDFDFVTADPKTVRAHVREEAKRVLDEDRAAEARREKEVLDYKAGLVSALEDWQKLNEVGEDVTNAVTLRLGKRLATLGVDPMSHITRENLATVLDDEYQRMKLEAQIESGKAAAEKSKSDIARAARASSPPAQRTASVKAVDPWIAEGRAPKPGEIRAKTIRALSEEGVDFDRLM